MISHFNQFVRAIPSDVPVLIAGATACGKSALALEIARHGGGVIINADALQVYGNWKVLTARPDTAAEIAAPHALYGHVPGEVPYSVGRWLRDLTPYLNADRRPILVGGTGLYFRALTEGLVDLPPIPPAVRELANKLRAENFAQMVHELDAATAANIDLQNPARVARAWEVLKTTGQGLHDWQRNTPPSTLPLSACYPILLEGPTDWLQKRIELRLDQMLAHGAVAEARANADDFDPSLPSGRVIGAAELIAHVQGEMSLPHAREAILTATRQYAKRQRTWFRARLGGWQNISAV